MGLKDMFDKMQESGQKLRDELEEDKNASVLDPSKHILYSDEKQIFSLKTDPSLPSDFIKYSDVEGAELQEDGKTTHGVNVARGIGLGALTLGSPIGVVAGLATGGKKKQKVELTIVIKFKNSFDKKIEFFKGKIKGSGEIFKETTVKEAIALTDLINSFPQKAQEKANEANVETVEEPTEPTPEQSSTTPEVDPLDQIKKLKELLDIGAITEDEFEAKKKQLLNL